MVGNELVTFLHFRAAEFRPRLSRTHKLQLEEITVYHYRLVGKMSLAPALLPVALFVGSQGLLAQSVFLEKDLVSDIPGRAAFTDPNLVNPWGIAISATSPFWISNAGSATSTLYNTSGTPQALVVSIPNGGAPTGQIFNGGTAFNADRFIFATEDGTIAGWRGGLGTAAETLFDNSSQGAIYKGLASATVGSSTYLYATDFHNNKIDVFSSAGAPSLMGSFMDSGVPVGFAPFNIQNLGGKLYVTYAKQDEDAHDDVAGPGNGFVDIFDLSGNMLQRLVSSGALNSPWGLALAPSSFGKLGGNLLVGNFGDGHINAYNATTGAWVETLSDTSGNPLEIEGLWGLAFGNGAAGGELNTLYFTAGISGGEEIEAHGLFGSISAVPEPGTGFAGAALVGMCGVLWFQRRKNKRASTLPASQP